MSEKLNWPLMADNISRADLDAVIAHLQQNDPKLTHGQNVAAFEREWSEWLGVKHSVMLNSGASANLLSLAALRELREPGSYRSAVDVGLGHRLRVPMRVHAGFCGY